LFEGCGKTATPKERVYILLEGFETKTLLALRVSARPHPTPCGHGGHKCAAIRGGLEVLFHRTVLRLA